ncbi:MAG: hypothetical protein HFF55_09815 [Lawsonibacter sp.]|nr:hypothetical protein [Lawsonibacter sp.]
MAFNYDIPVLELLDILGCPPDPDYQPDPRLPALLNDFLSRACDHPLFETADIWTWPGQFSYDAIEERIEEDRGYYAEHPEKLKENGPYTPFFKLPKEQWPTLVENYLVIGSDYAAGVVEFGIREADLSQPDPPVYMLHEGDPTGWGPFCPDLTSYLKYVLCAILCCETYETGMEVLEEAGWSFEELEEPEDAPMIPCIFDLSVCCGYDPDTKTVLAILSDAECKAYQIAKKD